MFQGHVGKFLELPSLKLAVSTCKWSLGRRLFPFGARPRGELLVFGRLSNNKITLRSETPGILMNSLGWLMGTLGVDSQNA